MAGPHDQQATPYRAPLFSGSPFRDPPFGETAQEVPSTICVSCPAALWYLTDKPNAFCNIMKIVTWPRATVPIKRCDGQQSAVAKLAEDMRKSAIARRSRESSGSTQTVPTD